MVGLGSFGGGAGAALYLRRQGAEVLVSDLALETDFGEQPEALRREGVEFAFGAQHPGLLEGVDWLVASPAVPWSVPLLIEASRRGLAVESEITLVARVLPCKWIGVTGTNGKTSTVRLLGAILRKAGRHPHVGGNLGGSLLVDGGPIGSHDLAVLELSSFQLEHLDEAGLGPPIALITNITPDHLDRHGSFEAYVRAKSAVLNRADTAILCCDNEGVRQLGKAFAGDILWYGSDSRDRPSPPFALEQGRFGHARGGSDRVDLSSMVMAGAHNRLNLVGAATAATAFGLRFEESLRAGLDEPPPAQRLQVLARSGGVTFVDDSVSTSPPAVVAALRAFDGRILLLVGGYDKGIGLRELLREIRIRCKKAYLYGAIGPRLAELLATRDLSCNESPRQKDGVREGGTAQWQVFPDLRAAFQAAADEASSGDVVLLSPGFASYDQFRNFQARGRQFQKMVRERAG